MLYSVPELAAITKIPYEANYCLWTSRLTPDQLEAIRSRINEMIDNEAILTSCWMPGPDWEGIPFQAIYEQAANFNKEIAARCFGLMVWVAFMERPEAWGFGRYEKNGYPITGITYFRLKNV
jgi:hypothetical protein